MRKAQVLRCLLNLCSLVDSWNHCCALIIAGYSYQIPQENSHLAPSTAGRLFRGGGSNLDILDRATDRNNMSRQSIPSTGLTAVVCPEKASLDVIFVHGFTGHPVRTWTHNKGDVSQQNFDENEILEPTPKKPKLNVFPKSQVCALPTLVVFSRSNYFAPMIWNYGCRKMYLNV